MFLCFTYFTLKMKRKKMCKRSVRGGLNCPSVPHCAILIAGITYRLLPSLVFGPHWGALETRLRYFSLVYIQCWHFEARDPGWSLTLCDSSDDFRTETRTVTPRLTRPPQCGMWTAWRHHSSPRAFLPPLLSPRGVRARLPVPSVPIAASHELTSQRCLPSDPVVEPKVVKLSFIHFTWRT